MNVNKYKLLYNISRGKELNIPIEMKWDFLDRSNDLDQYEEKTIKEVLNLDKDFETARFSHAVYSNDLTDINYDFYFAENADPSIGNWSMSYENEGFTPRELYYYANSFKESFFKLDFYDTPDATTQTNYITIIIPTQQGDTTQVVIGQKNLSVRKPKFKLDFLGDKEGFFIYWLKNRDFINIDTFYMSAKFFDAKVGVFKKMTNERQDGITPSPFNFKSDRFFYYKVELNYNNYTYQVFDKKNQRVGTNINPIEWYEYINPS